MHGIDNSSRVTGCYLACRRLYFADPSTMAQDSDDFVICQSQEQSMVQWIVASTSINDGVSSSLTSGREVVF